jgi:hypothetical protein
MVRAWAWVQGALVGAFACVERLAFPAWSERCGGG